MESAEPVGYTYQTQLAMLAKTGGCHMSQSPKSETSIALYLHPVPLKDLTDNSAAEHYKKLATDFFYWWHNQPGSNTQQGFDDWWKHHADRSLYAHPVPTVAKKETVERLSNERIEELWSELSNERFGIPVTSFARAIESALIEKTQ